MYDTLNTLGLVTGLTLGISYAIWWCIHLYRSERPEPSKYSLYIIVPKGWGFEKWLVNNKHYCSKLLVFKQGKRCSYHYHKRKHETFYILRGSFIIWASWDKGLNNATQLELNQGDSMVIPRGMRHRMQCISPGGGTILETSTTHYEEDSYIIEKGD